jgi:hypothetical protein
MTIYSLLRTNLQVVVNYLDLELALKLKQVMIKTTV